MDCSEPGSPARRLSPCWSLHWALSYAPGSGETVGRKSPAGDFGCAVDLATGRDREAPPRSSVPVDRGRQFSFSLSSFLSFWALIDRSVVCLLFVSLSLPLWGA